MVRVLLLFCLFLGVAAHAGAPDVSKCAIDRRLGYWILRGDDLTTAASRVAFEFKVPVEEALDQFKLKLKPDGCDDWIYEDADSIQDY